MSNIFPHMSHINWERGWHDTTCLWPRGGLDNHMPILFDLRSSGLEVWGNRSVHVSAQKTMAGNELFYEHRKTATYQHISTCVYIYTLYYMSTSTYMMHMYMNECTRVYLYAYIYMQLYSGLTIYLVGDLKNAVHPSSYKHASGKKEHKF